MGCGGGGGLISSYVISLYFSPVVNDIHIIFPICFIKFKVKMAFLSEKLLNYLELIHLRCLNQRNFPKLRNYKTYTFRTLFWY